MPKEPVAKMTEFLIVCVTDANGNIVYVGDSLPAGMGDSPTTINWSWDDTGLAAGYYTYAIEGRSLVGGGIFYNAKMIAEIGYR